LATVVEGKLLGINPLDQPGVQQYKNYMLGLLGREEEQRYKEEFERRPKPRVAYCCG
jgi:glucose-6-phosphate isomerase